MKIIEEIRQYRLLSLRFASYHFNPGVFSTFITLVFLYTMISLGFWQLDRAEFKDTLQQKIEQRKNLSAVGLSELPILSEDRRYMPVTLTGKYDTQHSFLLDNKTLNGHVGYHVFTPFIMSDNKAVLIARGFVEMGKTREQLPILVTPVDTIQIKGLIDLPPSRTIVLADNVQQTERWPVLLQYVDFAELEQILGYNLYDMMLWLDESKSKDSQNNDEKKSGIYKYDLPTLNLNSAKNNGYAFQWFAMSLALFIIYIVVNSKRQTNL
ncbi:Cytochrome oxidase biogenesis protein Surf1, facilitates heme A insertion [hydrothermal vent metagenome]|uniref:Cytochrome oxidase biogenesis protein Surf1, facilitates heme A insertion n=1 Tax=hydrothermal vent metagenome TaxID=652676 RepID=A0A3B0W775_9ZZZZ